MAVIHGAATAGASFRSHFKPWTCLHVEMCCGLLVQSFQVMAVATRSIGAPWNIHGDHTEIFLLRDAGWIIGMAENAQEAFEGKI